MTAASPAARASSDPIGTSRQHTSEPRWPLEQPPLDQAARHVIVVAGPSPAAQASTSAWFAGAETLGIACAVVPYDATAVAAALAAATTGTRVCVAGDEATIARTLALALAAGHVAAEVRAHLTDPDGPRTVQCVHCKAVTETTAAIDETCDCADCQRPLLLFPHFSRRIGAYLGFHAHAEELPGADEVLA